MKIVLNGHRQGSRHKLSATGLIKATSQIWKTSKCKKNEMPQRGGLIIEKSAAIKRLCRSHLKMEIPLQYGGGSAGACVL